MKSPTLFRAREPDQRAANAGRRFIPLLPGDCALPGTLRRCKVVDFREESAAAFAEVEKEVLA
jgi:hypothetical protein